MVFICDKHYDDDNAKELAPFELLVHTKRNLRHGERLNKQVLCIAHVLDVITELVGSVGLNNAETFTITRIQNDDGSTRPLKSIADLKDFEDEEDEEDEEEEDADDYPFWPDALILSELRARNRENGSKFHVSARTAKSKLIQMLRTDDADTDRAKAAGVANKYGCRFKKDAEEASRKRMGR